MSGSREEVNANFELEPAGERPPAAEKGAYGVDDRTIRRSQTLAFPSSTSSNDPKYHREMPAETREPARLRVASQRLPVGEHTDHAGFMRAEYLAGQFLRCRAHTSNGPCHGRSQPADQKKPTLILRCARETLISKPPHCLSSSID